MQKMRKIVLKNAFISVNYPTLMSSMLIPQYWCFRQNEYATSDLHKAPIRWIPKSQISKHKFRHHCWNNLTLSHFSCYIIIWFKFHVNIIFVSLVKPFLPNVTWSIENSKSNDYFLFKIQHWAGMVKDRLCKLDIWPGIRKSKKSPSGFSSVLLVWPKYQTLDLVWMFSRSFS